MDINRSVCVNRSNAIGYITNCDKVSLERLRIRIVHRYYLAYLESSIMYHRHKAT